MTTVSEIVKDALQDLNVYGPSDSVSAHDAQYCLRALNKMISQWQVQKMFVPGQHTQSFPCNGQQVYTIGPSAQIDTTLPVTVDAAYYRLNNIDYPLTVLHSFEDYSNITLKELDGTIPNVVFFQRQWPQGNVYVWPQPSQGQIFLVLRDILQQYESLTDDIEVPQEYALAMQYSLEEKIARTFGRQVTPDLRVDAKTARDVLKRNNIDIPMMGMPQGILSNGRFSIYTGQ